MQYVRVGSSLRPLANRSTAKKDCTGGLVNDLTYIEYKTIYNFLLLLHGLVFSTLGLGPHLFGCGLLATFTEALANFPLVDFLEIFLGAFEPASTYFMFNIQMLCQTNLF